MKRITPLMLALASAPVMADDEASQLIARADLSSVPVLDGVRAEEKEVSSVSEQASPVGLSVYQVKENVFRWEDAPPGSLVVQESLETEAPIVEETPFESGWLFTL